MTSEFLTRHLNSAYALSLPAAALLGAAATYGPRMLAGSPIHSEPQVIGEFAFHNGLLLPHQEYLYGSSGTGEPFIVGKKLAGEDYSAWEAGYQNFARLRSLTYANSGSKSTWSWSFEEPGTPAGFNIWKLLFWVVFGILCIALLSYAARKIVSRVSRKKSGNEEGILALPTSSIDVENSKLNGVWRSTLIRMYRERKSEILALTMLVVHYYNISCDLAESLAEEKEKKGEAKSALEALKAEHAHELGKQREEMDDLRQRLDAQCTRAGDAETHNHRLEAELDGAKETIRSLEEHVAALESSTENKNDTEPLDEDEERTVKQDDVTPADLEEEEEEKTVTQDDVTPADLEEEEEEKTVTQDDVTPADLEEEEEEKTVKQDDVTPADLEEEEEEKTVKQDDVTPADLGVEEEEKKVKQDDGTPADGPKLGKNGKPLIPRANRRADGTNRTATHPDYVPPQRPSSQLGDRPFQGLPGNGPGPGNGRGRGVRGGWSGGVDDAGPFGYRGGRGGRGWGDRGSNDGAPFGWRGGRGRGRARRGPDAYNGHFNQGRGQ